MLYGETNIKACIFPTKKVVPENSLNRLNCIKWCRRPDLPDSK